ncbi:MAG: hypothetical protein IJA36_11865 [Lachnospiraceae bacterium]|nr:hypothetical protein [Lachnospiraceae bacterium]
MEEILGDANSTLEEIKNFGADYVVLEMRKEMVSLVTELLVQNCQIELKRIVDFYKIYYGMFTGPKIQKLMKNPKYHYIKGIIMGLSHAETGLVSSMFPESVCNIATGGQDIYDNWKSLEWVREHHKNNLKDLEYVIFDMYDYSYFNVDTSLGKNAVNYYVNWDGYLWDGHHFDDNKNFNYSFAQLRQIIETQNNNGITLQEQENFKLLFPQILRNFLHEQLDDDFKVKNITKVVTEQELEAYEIGTSVVKKLFNETQKENKEAFERILILLKELNPNMRIKIVLMPRTAYVEKKMEPYDKVSRTEYMEYLEQMQEKYSFEIFDLKSLEEISTHQEYYYAGEHLNRNGAERFTKYFLENCME